MILCISYKKSFHYTRKQLYFPMASSDAVSDNASIIEDDATNPCDFDKLLYHSVPSTTHSQTMHSQHLLRQQNINELLGMQRKQKCFLLQCNSMNRIIDILKKYNLFIQNQKNSQSTQSLDSIYNANYNDTHLLNDYYHLLINHSNEHEEIYVQINKTIYQNKQCDLFQCSLIRRNNRNRDKFAPKQYFSVDSHHIVRQQLIDRIHCYYLHSFDTGHKITREEIHNIQNKRDISFEAKISNDNNVADNSDIIVRRINFLQKSKQHLVRNIPELHRENAKRYQFTQVTNADSKQNSQYSFGYRYFYWDYYKN
eukprot:333494_1